jgi:hypothetical protein
MIVQMEIHNFEGKRKNPQKEEDKKAILNKALGIVYAFVKDFLIFIS